LASPQFLKEIVLAEGRRRKHAGVSASAALGGKSARVVEEAEGVFSVKGVYVKKGESGRMGKVKTQAGHGCSTGEGGR